MGTHRVVFVGGPLDGMSKEVDAGLGVFEVPLDTLDGATIHHRYGQADLVDPDQAATTPQGERRYLYLGEAKQF